MLFCSDFQPHRTLVAGAATEARGKVKFNNCCAKIVHNILNLLENELMKLKMMQFGGTYVESKLRGRRMKKKKKKTRSKNC